MVNSNNVIYRKGRKNVYTACDDEKLIKECQVEMYIASDLSIFKNCRNKNTINTESIRINKNMYETNPLPNKCQKKVKTYADCLKINNTLVGSMALPKLYIKGKVGILMKHSPSIISIKDYILQINSHIKPSLKRNNTAKKNTTNYQYLKSNLKKIKFIPIECAIAKGTMKQFEWYKPSKVSALGNIQQHLIPLKNKYDLLTVPKTNEESSLNYSDKSALRNNGTQMRSNIPGDNGTSKRGDTPKDSGAQKGGDTSRKDGTSMRGDMSRNHGSTMIGDTSRDDFTKMKGDISRNYSTSTIGDTSKSNGTPVRGDTSRPGSSPLRGDTPGNDSSPVGGVPPRHDGRQMRRDAPGNDSSILRGDTTRNDNSKLKGDNPDKNGTQVKGDTSGNESTSMRGGTL
jgi:cytoskeletal protein CcmA (bactofilin family)